MRILKFLFFSFLALTIVAILTFFIGREVLLFWGVSTVNASLSALDTIAVRPASYLQTCQRKGAPSGQTIVTGLQLRFLSSQEYVLEVICNGLQFDPIVVTDKKLPPLVTKVAGSGGIVWGDQPSSISLTVLGRTQTIGVQNRAIINLGKDPAGGVSPQTTCLGQGYKCCSGDSEFGTGLVQNQVIDCPKTCYATCLPRPIVLSFTSDPLADQTTRIVTISANQTVSFNYVVSYQNPADPKALPTITLDFGDGQNQIFKKTTGKTDHLYTCNVGVCHYQVNLSVQTTAQINSVPNAISKMTIQVQP